jgi:hypothetical protein
MIVEHKHKMSGISPSDEDEINMFSTNGGRCFNLFGIL